MTNITHIKRNLSKEEVKSFEESVELYTAYTNLISSYSYEEEINPSNGENNTIICSIIAKRYELSALIIASFYEEVYTEVTIVDNNLNQVNSK